MEKILIVDDDSFTQTILTELLAPHYQIILANNGKEGFEKALQDKPDIIIMDKVMPIMDGFESTKIIKANEHTQHIPIIFITVIADVAEIVHALELGAIDYIVKPFHDLEVLSRVKNHLDLALAHKKITELEKKNSVLAMAVTVNHELRQPLTVLRGYFDSLINNLVEEDQKKNEKHISRINSAIDGIVKKLNIYSNSPNFTIDDYLVDTDYAKNIRMVRYDEE